MPIFDKLRCRNVRDVTTVTFKMYVNKFKFND